MILRGDRLLLRTITPADVAAVAAIAAEPEVSRWWGAVSEQELAERAAAGPGEAVALVAEADGRVIGLVQYSEEPDPMYRHATIDLFLSAAYHGRGLGREAVELVVRHLFEDRRHHRITIDPAAANRAAIRCYEAVGFAAVGVMRRYERGADGSFHDGLLMELVRDPQ
jgi:aminoglycoside 6'-N-acetyltransferase